MSSSRPTSATRQSASIRSAARNFEARETRAERSYPLSAPTPLFLSPLAPFSLAPRPFFSRPSTEIRDRFVRDRRGRLASDRGIRPAAGRLAFSGFGGGSDRPARGR